MKMKNPKTTNAGNQKQLFIETARELECDEDEDRFNETLKRIAPKTNETAPVVKPTGDQTHQPEDQS